MQMMLLSKLAAEDDLLARQVDVGGLVHHDGRVARPGTDGALAGGHCQLDHRAAARDEQDADAGMLHQRLRALDGRLGRRSQQVRRAARARRSPG